MDKMKGAAKRLFGVNSVKDLSYRGQISAKRNLRIPRKTAKEMHKSDLVYDFLFIKNIFLQCKMLDHSALKCGSGSGASITSSNDFFAATGFDSSFPITGFGILQVGPGEILFTADSFCAPGDSNHKEKAGYLTMEKTKYSLSKKDAQILLNLITACIDFPSQEGRVSKGAESYELGDSLAYFSKEDYVSDSVMQDYELGDASAYFLNMIFSYLRSFINGVKIPDDVSKFFNNYYYLTKPYKIDEKFETERRKIKCKNQDEVEESEILGVHNKKLAVTAKKLEDRVFLVDRCLYRSVHAFISEKEIDYDRDTSGVKEYTGAQYISGDEKYLPMKSFMCIFLDMSCRLGLEDRGQQDEKVEYKLLLDQSTKGSEKLVITRRFTTKDGQCFTNNASLAVSDFDEVRELCKELLGDKFMNPLIPERFKNILKTFSDNLKIGFWSSKSSDKLSSIKNITGTYDASGETLVESGDFVSVFKGGVCTTEFSLGCMGVGNPSEATNTPDGKEGVGTKKSVSCDEEWTVLSAEDVPGNGTRVGVGALKFDSDRTNSNPFADESTGRKVVKEGKELQTLSPESCKKNREELQKEIEEEKKELKVEGKELRNLLDRFHEKGGEYIGKEN